MNILFVAYHTCARASKEAKALESAGHQVIILQHVAASEEILYSTELASFFNDEQSLSKRISYFGDWAEVIHVHNEPNWIVTAAAMQRNLSCPDIPIIFDVHDLESMRESGEIDKDETTAIHAADGFIFPSRAYQYGIRLTRNIQKVPGRVIYSMCNSDEIVESPLPRVNGIVYEGAIVAPIKGFDASTSGYKRYRDYVAFANELTARGIPFHLYGVRDAFSKNYIDAGAVVHGVLPFSDMLKQISRYDWGFCGHNDVHPQWEKAMPNKLFEYIAAGIPTIALNASEVGEFINLHRLGLVVDSVGMLSRIVNNDDIRETVGNLVLENRYKFNMESQVSEIENLYAEASDYRKSKFVDGLRLRRIETIRKANGQWVCFEQPKGTTTEVIGGDKLSTDIPGSTGEDQKKIQGELPA